MFGGEYGNVTVTIRFCAANDPSLTGIAFAPTWAEAFRLKAHLERRD
jgi:hypothetical protein